MALTVQNLRSITPGVEPTTLMPGQLCFNVADQVMFVGDGSDFYTYQDGSQAPAPAGAGWFASALSIQGLEDFFLENPERYGPPPLNNQVLSYSSALGKPVWTSAGDLGAATVYEVTNAEVDAAPGVTLSDKISSAIGATPVESDVAIVTGVPGDTYQGLYFFRSGVWTFGAGYADPVALQVPYDNTLSGLVAATVQAAIDELSALKQDAPSNTPNVGDVFSWNGVAPTWIPPSSIYPSADNVSFDPAGTGLPSFANNVQQALTLTWQLGNNAQTDATQALADATAAQNTANIALNNSIDAVNTANNALAVANQALPKAGGTMTGDIVFNGGQPVDAGTF